MKTSHHLILIWVITLAGAPPLLGASAPELRITERGPHHRVWSRVTPHTTARGKVYFQTNSYQELATGMHYWKEGWADSQELIEIVNGFGVARHGQHQVIFTPNLNTAGAIDLLAPDGQRFRSHVLGLAYTDAATGKSVLIAEIKDSIGEVITPNQVIYRDAFTDFRADVRYTYTRAGFEQDIILRENPPSPLAFGLNPETTRLEVLTEFLAPPVPTKEVRVLKQETNPVLRAAMVEPDLVDEILHFGMMTIGPGQAFPLEEDPTDAFAEAGAPTGKSWEQRVDEAGNVRDFLVEKVAYSDIRGHLAVLPQAAAALNREPRAKAERLKRLAQLPERKFPPAPQQAKAGGQPLRLAQAVGTEKGLVLDYITLNSSQSNHTFKSDTTTFISGTVTLNGTTTIEGGSVVKFTNNVSPKLVLTGPVDCRTSPFRPAIFTAFDDNAIGETIAGSSGTPSGTYAFRALELNYNGNTNQLHDLRVRYASRGIFVNSGTALSLKHAQFGFGFRAVEGSTATPFSIQNILIHNYTHGMASWSTARVEHATMHQVFTAWSGTSGTNGFLLTNCLLISVTNIAYSGSNVVTNRDDTGFFQTVGAGVHYLAANSPYRNSGTTNINALLLSELKQRTTYPPIVLTNNITANSTLSPQAQRQGDRPDLGYAYNPLDFVLSGLVLTNATLTIDPGTVIGVYGGDGTHALKLEGGANLICEGSATSPNRIVRYNLVQEQANTNWAASTTGRSIATADSWATGVPAPVARFRFTHWRLPAGAKEHFYGAYHQMADALNVSFRDCEFGSGLFYCESPLAYLTNCLFDRVELRVFSAASEYGNCLFRGGYWAVDGTFGTHAATNNFFDLTDIDTNWFGVNNGYNGYLTNAARLIPNASTDVILTNTSITYDPGPLGYFYLPTNLALINAGSTNADRLRLYHYTTAAASQAKETNSIVDISYHYIALNAQNQPSDTDGEGLSDYQEDADNNASVDSGETDWNDADTDADGVSDYIEVLQGRNPLAGANTDTNGIINLRVYTPLK